MPHLEHIPSGRPGTIRTLEVMRGLVEKGKRSPGFVHLARRIVSRVPERDTVGEINALANFVHRRTRFVHDPVGVEALSDPVSILRHKSGDCDERVVLLSALAESVGYKTRPKVIGSSPGRYHHVLLEVQDYKSGNWIPIDPSAPHGAGWEPVASVSETYDGGLGDLGTCHEGCKCMACVARQLSPVVAGSLVNPARQISFPMRSQAPVSTEGELYGLGALGFLKKLKGLKKKMRKKAAKMPGAQLVRKLPGAGRFIGRKQKKRKRVKSAPTPLSPYGPTAAYPYGGPPILSPVPYAQPPYGVPTAYDGAYSPAYDVAYGPAQSPVPGLVPPPIYTPEPAYSPPYYEEVYGGGGGGGGEEYYEAQFGPQQGFEPEAYGFDRPMPEEWAADQPSYPDAPWNYDSGMFGIGDVGKDVSTLVIVGIVAAVFATGRRRR